MHSQKSCSEGRGFLPLFFGFGLDLDICFGFGFGFGFVSIFVSIFFFSFPTLFVQTLTPYFNIL